MSADPRATPFSLLQLFKAPDGYRGIFGFVCGYSADAGFLDAALEGFTRHTAAQRAVEGRLSLLLMLDPGHPQISFTAVPGLCHAPFRTDIARPFRLMHAKVALLGFRHEQQPEDWRIRLVVSTGNWTRQTVEDSLDLAWHIGMGPDGLARQVDDVVRQNRLDIATAWQFMTTLRGHYACGMLDRQPGPQEVAAWLDDLSARAGRGMPRFLHNREESLLQQLLRRAPGDKGGWAPNRLAIGSGFYEEGAAGQVPRVLDELVSGLRARGAVHGDTEVSVFVNPQACQAVAGGFKAMVRRGWTVRAATAPPAWGHVPRQLHAKFVFAAHRREPGETCHGAWLYLGSGNLTGPGFLQRAGTTGNLEAGVMLQPEGLQWRAGKRRRGGPVVTDLLPIHWDGAITDLRDLAAGPGMPARGADYVAAPVGWFEWAEADAAQGGRLKPAGGSPTARLDVIGPDGAACKRRAGEYAWPGARPRQVEVRWQGHGIWVPVIDALGRVAADALPALQLDQALGHLAGFPDPIADDDDGPGDDGDDEGGEAAAGKDRRRARAVPAADYPFRQMMIFLETIAARQTALMPPEWPYWCARLEQILAQSAEAAVVAYFRELGLNPLQALRAAPFRPDFSLTVPDARRCYEQALDRAERAWRVADLKPLGVA